MAEYYNVTTNLGDAEIAAAITNNAKIQITHIAFGDGAGSVPNPSKTRTTLVREVHRQAVTKYERHPTNPNWIVIETIIPSDIGGFTIREMGIIGNGKLLSHGSHAPFEKVADPSGVSEYRLKFTQNITDGNVVSITLDDSLIYATQAWVEENFIKRSEIIDNTSTDDATKPVSAKQAKKLQDEKLAKSSNLSDLPSAAAARTNLGLGTAAVKNATSSVTDYDASKVMSVGAFGFGQSSSSAYGNIGLVVLSLEDSATTEQLDRTQMVSAANDGGMGYPCGLYFPAGAYKGHGILGSTITGSLYHYYMANRNAAQGAARGAVKSLIRTAANTTVDPNGFLKNASPIVKLFADKIELNDEAQQQSITFEKLGVGDYLIKNSTGLSNDGWYIEQPRDANGNIYHAVVHEQLESGDISIKTYECKLNEIGQTVADLEKPIDIKENRFITLRLNELPRDTAAPQNPNVVDSEGNPAPSKYHYLENGEWKITAENEVTLENERYAAYQASLRPLTRRQFKLALLENGLLDQIENSISAIEDDQMRARIQIEYAEATEFHRTSDSVAYMCQLLGLTYEQVDQMWEQALTL